MIRKVLFTIFVVVNLSGMAQVNLSFNDSLSTYLVKNEEVLNGEDTIRDLDYDNVTAPTPLTTLPVVDSCEGVDRDSIRACMNRYFKDLVKREAQIPEALKDSVFYEKIYFRIILDENAKIEKIDTPHEPILLEPYRKERLSLLLLEAKRVLDKASFSKSAYQGDRAVKFSLIIPITFSNPPKGEKH